MFEKSAKNSQFLSKVMKNMHYGPISQKKLISIFFKFTFLECREGPIERYLEV
jgi:hypothetical protein